MSFRLEALAFADLPGWECDDHFAAHAVFMRSAPALAAGAAGPRPATAPSPGLVAAARMALAAPSAGARAARLFFESKFEPFRVIPDSGRGFVTGYYEPRVSASRVETAAFGWPILARPPDLVAFPPGEPPAGIPQGITGAKRLPDGSLVPYPERASIERQRRDPIVWVEDAVEAFLIHVQGSAQVEFSDGSLARLAYDGRNGLPYASIGRMLIDAGEIPERAMSLARLKAWLRHAGDKGEALMRCNRSFVFFKLVEAFDPSVGPVAGAGAALTPLRSIAVDRAVWPYGLPVWLNAEAPWEGEAPSPFRRLTIAQDTGSAIVGPARVDLFFGGGEAAGTRAGDMRHACEFVVLTPRGEKR